MYFSNLFGTKCYGLEPSKEAVEFGNNLAKEKKLDVCLKQGTADKIDFADDSFEIVMLGFCMYSVDRKYVTQVVSEIDRVLKTGGFLLTWDFDTNIPYRRKNVHSEFVPTFKYDLAKLFLNNPVYSLVKKEPFSANNEHIFEREVQNRCALNILYKENIQDAYIFN